MPTEVPSPSNAEGVITKVLTECLKALEGEAAIDPATAQRLREVLLTKQEYTVDALKAALFADDPIP